MKIHFRVTNNNNNNPATVAVKLTFYIHSQSNNYPFFRRTTGNWGDLEKLLTYTNDVSNSYRYFASSSMRGKA